MEISIKVAFIWVMKATFLLNCHQKAFIGLTFSVPHDELRDSPLVRPPKHNSESFLANE